jgi:hypothetical protein
MQQLTFGAPMDKKSLKESFDRLIATLKCVPNVADEMLRFDGSANDIETIGYFFYEGVLSDSSRDCLNALRYILGHVLESSYGFDWKGTVLEHPNFNIRLDLASIQIDQSQQSDAFDAINAHFDSINQKLSKFRVFGL